LGADGRQVAGNGGFAHPALLIEHNVAHGPACERCLMRSLCTAASAFS
jgi:hypothetical protein